ncbi:innexin inx1 [Hetaerina americana]|uniref:innexin inx1 n=1 Tax=Hetaerina americana TaxID=62018 RepID=UPI003A7F1DC4
MYKLLGGLKDYLKWQDIVTDNAVFRLHNLFTTVMLLSFSLIVTATQYVGNPIQCIASGVPMKVINTYCWITSTFTMPDAFYRQAGVEVAHPGVGPDIPRGLPGGGLYGRGAEDDPRKYYTYYQWVCFVLFFQAILCYTPKWLWDNWEGGLMRTIVMGLNVGLHTEKDKKKKKEVLIDYLLKHIKRHNMYALRYWMCEFLCLVNIIGQLYLMNHFFDGEFISYGLKVASFSEQSQEERADPMVYVFPRVTKCTFHKFGPSGSLVRHDSLCVLPLNVVNEKTYVFLWFWFIILATLLSALVAYRAILLAAPSLRPRLLSARHRGSVPRETADIVAREAEVGDWWLLYMLGRNIDPCIYKEVVAELAKKMETAASNSGPRVPREMPSAPSSYDAHPPHEKHSLTDV